MEWASVGSTQLAGSGRSRAGQAYASAAREEHNLGHSRAWTKRPACIIQHSTPTPPRFHSSATAPHLVVDCSGQFTLQVLEHDAKAAVSRHPAPAPVPVPGACSTVQLDCLQHSPGSCSPTATAQSLLSQNVGLNQATVKLYSEGTWREHTTPHRCHQHTCSSFCQPVECWTWVFAGEGTPQPAVK